MGGVTAPAEEALVGTEGGRTSVDLVEVSRSVSESAGEREDDVKRVRHWLWVPLHSYTVSLLHRCRYLDQISFYKWAWSCPSCHTLPPHPTSPSVASSCSSVLLLERLGVEGEGEREINLLFLLFFFVV